MKRLLALLAFLVMAALPIVATYEAGDKDDEQYVKATQALDDERWTAAIAGFRQIVNAKGPRVDRALYWLAHAQFKAGKPTDALSTLQDLRSRYPKSDWIDDAAAMEVEIRGTTGSPVAPERLDDEELKMIAISSLMGTDPDRAIGLLEKMLSAKESSNAVMERALFVLGQMDSARAQKMLEAFARDGSHPDRQRQAIRSIGINQGGNKGGGNALLAEIYRSTANAETKGAIIESYMISNDRARLLEVAEGDTDAHMRSQAAQKLGVMHATAELQRLYAKERSSEVKDSIIQGLFLAGDLETLARLAKTEPDQQLRKNAIRGLGMIEGKRSYDLLMEIWSAGGSTAEMKEGVVDALFIRGDAKALIALARKEADRRVRRELVQRIALMQQPEARAYMQELLDN
jgi:tetratricopeptide (TPR) repeat protein